MKKGDKPNPGEEFFYKLSLKKEFEEDLVIARKKIGIPNAGFTDEDEHLHWMSTPGDPQRTFDTIFSLREKYKIPITYTHLLHKILFYGDDEVKESERPDIMTILPPAHLCDPSGSDLEHYYRQHGEPYVRILILANAKKSDIIRELGLCWDQVEEILKTQGWIKPKKIRKTVNKVRNKLIKELWRKPIKDLKTEVKRYAPNDILKRKESLIKKILQHKGYKDFDKKGFGEAVIKKIGSTK
ncbi:MAG: hypothetical protein WC477_02300 [Patescibacteria group bacterium]